MAKGQREDRVMSTATFFPTTYSPMDATHSYRLTMSDIDEGLDIRTTQMALLNECKGYDEIRIVESPDDVIVITNNHDGTYDCDRTERCLRRVHNLYKLWASGEFDR